MNSPLNSTLAHEQACAPLFNRGVSVLCWAYNEEILIEDFIRRLKELMDKTVADYEIVIVDDGSTDNTSKIIKELMTEIPQLQLYENEVNRNVGYSCKKAIAKARKEFFFWQTIDWAYDISELRNFLELLTEYDVVAGVRRHPVKVRGLVVRPALFLLQVFGIKHITRRSDTIQKALVSIINYTLIRILFRVPLSDYQNVVFYRTKTVQSFEIEADSSFINPEILIKSYWRNAKMVEVPISFLPRQSGEAKGTKLKAIKRAVQDILKYRIKWLFSETNKGRVENIKRLGL